VHEDFGLKKRKVGVHIKNPQNQIADLGCLPKVMFAPRFDFPATREPTFEILPFLKCGYAQSHCNFQLDMIGYE